VLIKKIKRFENTMSRVVDHWFDSTIGGYIIEFSIDIVESYGQVERYFFKGPRGKFLQFLKLRIKMLLHENNILKVPTFRADGSEDLDQHWFLCEAMWSIENVTDEVVKRAQFSTTLRDRALRWYMKFVQGDAPKPLNVIKTVLIYEFKKPKSELQCITKLKEIKQRIVEPVWEFDQRFKTLTCHLSFQILDEKKKEWFIDALLPHIKVPLMQQNISL
jgi:hypothetical protein